MFENRKYLVIDVGEISKIDFSKIMENDINDLQYYGNGEYTVIKWEGDDPEFIANIEKFHGPFNIDEIKNLARFYGDKIYDPIILNK